MRHVDLIYQVLGLVIAVCGGLLFNLLSSVTVVHTTRIAIAGSLG